MPLSLWRNLKLRMRVLCKQNPVCLIASCYFASATVCLIWCGARSTSEPVRNPHISGRPNRVHGRRRVIRARSVSSYYTRHVADKWRAHAQRTGRTGHIRWASEVVRGIVEPRSAVWSTRLRCTDDPRVNGTSLKYDNYNYTFIYCVRRMLCNSTADVRHSCDVLIKEWLVNGLSLHFAFQFKPKCSLQGRLGFTVFTAKGGCLGPFKSFEH